MFPSLPIIAPSPIVSSTIAIITPASASPGPIPLITSRWWGCAVALVPAIAALGRASGWGPAVVVVDDSCVWGTHASTHASAHASAHFVILAVISQSLSQHDTAYSSSARAQQARTHSPHAPGLGGRGALDNCNQGKCVSFCLDGRIVPCRQQTMPECLKMLIKEKSQ